jgi:thioredoxin 1
MTAEMSVTQNEFDEKVLKSQIPVLVDFWAAWCGPCKAIGPSIEQLAEEYDGKAKVFKVDVDSDSDLATQYNVVSIPALVVFKDGKVFEQKVGAMAKKDIAALIDRAL